MHTHYKLKVKLSKKLQKRMVSLSDLEIQELDGQRLKKIEMKALRCFRQLRLKKLQKTEQEEEYHNEFEHFRMVSATTDYREFLTQHCTTNI